MALLTRIADDYDQLENKTNVADLIPERLIQCIFPPGLIRGDYEFFKVTAVNLFVHGLPGRYSLSVHGKTNPYVGTRTGTFSLGDELTAQDVVRLVDYVDQEIRLSKAQISQQAGQGLLGDIDVLTSIEDLRDRASFADYNTLLAASDRDSWQSLIGKGIARLPNGSISGIVVKAYHATIKYALHRWIAEGGLRGQFSEHPSVFSGKC